MIIPIILPIIMMIYDEARLPVLRLRSDIPFEGVCSLCFIVFSPSKRIIEKTLLNLYEIKSCSTEKQEKGEKNAAN